MLPTASVTAAYLDRCFDAIGQVLDRVRPDLVDVPPHGPSTNSVSGLVVHCCGVTEFWLGHIALGRPSTRDRDAEFTTALPVDELRRLLAAARTQTHDDFAEIERRHAAGEPEHDHELRVFLERPCDDESLVLKVLHEISWHVGHLELTADALAER